MNIDFPTAAKRLSKRLFLASVLLLLTGFITVFGQALTLLNVNVGRFPIIRGQFYAVDSAGRLITGVLAQNATISENGVPRQIISVSCPVPPPPKPLSVVLTLDVSGSMGFAADGVTRNIDIMRDAAKAFVNILPLGMPSSILPNGSECAVTSFDHENYLNQDFTFDRSRLTRAIDGLTPQGGADFDVALLTRPFGAVEVAKNGRFARTIILFTDGSGGGNETDIIREARRQNARVYVLTLGTRAPLVLRNVAQETGGLVFDNLATVQQARQAFLTALLVAQDAKPCEIEWESAPPVADCGSPGIFFRGVRLAVQGSLFGLTAMQSVSGSWEYALPAPPQAQLFVNPPSVGFLLNQSQVGISQTRLITISAANHNYRISNILSSDTNFRISPTNFTLAAGESRTLTVSFTPRADGFASTVFSVVADSCPTSFYAVARTIVPPPRPTLVVEFPNGRERLVAGTDSLITWRGISPFDTVRLEYSIDSGRTWTLIAENASGLRHQWEQIPNTPGEQALMRVSQLVTAPDADTVNVVPANTGYANFVLRGERVAIGFDGQVTFWEALLPVFYGGQIRHRNSIRSTAVSPDGARLASADDNGTIVIWNTALSQLFSAIVGNVGNAVRYSPDGRFLATAGGLDPDNPAVALLQFYNATTTELVREIRYSAGFGRPREIFFSPDSQIIGMVRSDGGLAFWNVQTGSPLQAPIGSSRDVNSATFNSNGTELILAKTTGGERWDWQRGLILRRFGTGLNMVSVRISPNGRRIITASLTGGVHIWDAGGLNAQIRHLPSPNQEARYAEFHPDSRRFLTVVEQTTRVYALAEPVVLQSDISDNLWAIVAPNAVGFDIDMRNSLVNTPKDSVVRAFIRNMGTYPVRLDSIYFSGINPEEFEHLAGAPALIPVGGAQNVEFRFRPRAAGERTARLNVAFRHTTLQYNIRGNGITPALQVIAGSVIDFGTILVGTQRDTVVRAVLVNTGTTPIGVSATQLGGPDNVQFVILSPAQMFTLAPGESRQITLRFAPNQLGRANGSLVFIYGDGTRSTVRLLGNAMLVLPTPPCTLRLSDTSGRPNDTICLSLLQTCSEQPSFSTSVTVLVSYNATLLMPQSPTPLGVVADGIRYIPITLNLRAVPTTASVGQLDTRPLENLCFRVMLGNTTATRINLEVISPPGAFLNVSSASFRLVNSQAGGSHLFFSTSASLRILSTQPNPAIDQITVRYTTPTSGTITLSLIDVFGRTVRTQVLMPRSGGQQETSLPVADVPNGVYFVRLSSALETASQRVLIAR